MVDVFRRLAAVATVSPRMDGFTTRLPWSVWCRIVDGDGARLGGELIAIGLANAHGNRLMLTRSYYLLLVIVLLLQTIVAAQVPATKLSAIKISDDGRGFVDDQGRPFRVWGVNYDHDDAGQLIEDYWTSDWPRVVEDMEEIKALGANVVRIHLQLGKFMKGPEEPQPESLAKLADLVQLAERLGLYLDLTGLACYHKADVPAWYDALDEQRRWQVQARFWREIASVCKESAAIFCYDLMNEPILPGNQPEKEWLAGELAGKFFVQRVTLDLQGRTREQVAEAWIAHLTQAVRQVDRTHLITVGVIPWSHVFPGAKPIFYAPGPAKHLDFVSIHIYPKANEVQKALDALTVYRIGKPLVVEEFFPLSCSIEEAQTFLDKAQVEGVISFYWGKSIEQYAQDNDLKGALLAKWLEAFKTLAPAKQ